MTTLRGETKRGRLDWLREEHPRSVVISVIWLVGTIGLAVALLVDDGYTGRAHYLSVLTPVVAPMLFLGTMEFCYRHQRRGNNWLATEIEASLHDRLLPYLPPHSCDR